jgi:hypothetical protein
MSCPDITYSARGRAGLGVVQPQSGLDYPLISPSDDIRYLLADFYFAHNWLADYSGGPAITYPLRIKRLYGVGCVDSPAPTDHVPRGGLAADIVLAAGDNQIVFDTTTADILTESVAAWGTDYDIYTWTTRDAVCRMLVHTTWTAADGEVRDYAKYLAPVSAELDARSVYRMPKHIRSLSVRNGNVRSGAYRGPVILQNGYNTELTAGDATTVRLRRTTTVQLAAVPGSGTGQYPCIDNDSTASFPIKNVNGVTPREAGHFLLGAADCLWARRPTVYSEISPAPIPQTAAQQQLGADCKPCCGCTDYAATALYMNATSDKYKFLGRQAEEIKQLHEANITRWNIYRQCTIGNPLKLVLFPQRSPFVDVALMLCNSCTDCFPAATLQLEITPTDGTAADGTPLDVGTLDATVVCGYTEAYFPGINARTTTITKPTRLTYNVFFPQLKAGDNGYVKFRLEFSVRGKFEFEANLTGTFAGNNPIPLNCGAEDVVGEGPVPANAAAQLAVNFNLAGIASRLC